MTENLFEAQYDLTKKSKLKKFYDSYKIFIYSSIIFILIAFGSITYYLESKEKKRILLSENYLQAKIYLESDKKEEAKKILKEIIFKNDNTYSTLSFFLILNQRLITDYGELSNIFNHILENNKFEKEIESLLIYKQGVLNSNYVDEAKMLTDLGPLLSDKENLWRPHALLLLGDYFISKNQNLKAIEFYTQILSIKDLHRDIYEQAKSRLSFIAND